MKENSLKPRSCIVSNLRNSQVPARLSAFPPRCRKPGKTRKARLLSKIGLPAIPTTKTSALRFRRTTSRSGQFDAARAEAEQLLAIAPDLAANLNNLAWLYDQKGDTEKALELSRKAYELSPKRSEIADTLGWLLIRQGDTAAAMPLLEQAFKAAPDNPEIGYHYAWALSKGGKMAQATEIIGKVLKSPNEFPGRKDAEQLGMTLKAP